MATVETVGDDGMHKRFSQDSFFRDIYDASSIDQSNMEPVVNPFESEDEADEPSFNTLHGSSSPSAHPKHVTEDIPKYIFRDDDSLFLGSEMGETSSVRENPFGNEEEEKALDATLDRLLRMKAGANQSVQSEQGGLKSLADEILEHAHKSGLEVGQEDGFVGDVLAELEVQERHLMEHDEDQDDDAPGTPTEDGTHLRKVQDYGMPVQDTVGYGYTTPKMDERALEPVTDMAGADVITMASTAYTSHATARTHADHEDEPAKDVPAEDGSDENHADLAIPVSRDINHSKGFVNAKESVGAVICSITGELPGWLNGTLFTVGPGTFDVAYQVQGDNEAETQVYSFGHWLDALPLVQKFNIDGSSGLVRYASRLTAKKLESKIRDAHGYTPSRPNTLYRTDTNQSFFASWFTPAVKDPIPGHEACGANIAARFPVNDIPGGAIACFGNGNCVVTLDARDLMPVKATLWSGINEKFQATQVTPKVVRDAMTGEVFAVAMDPGFQTTDYHVIRLTHGDPKGQIVATVNLPRVSLIHSLALTQHFIILTIYPFVNSALGLKYFTKSPILDSLEFNPSEPTLFYVISRDENKVLVSYKTDAFFAMNHINAFEFGAGDAVFVDVCAYTDDDILRRFVLPMLRDPDTAPGPTPVGEYRRYQLPRFSEELTRQQMLEEASPADAVWKRIMEPGLECPVINETKRGVVCKFVYGLGISPNASALPGRLYDSILKYSLESRSLHRVWHEEGAYPAGPYFIPKPYDGTELAEDEGLLLSVVYSAVRHESFLVVLDAGSLQEVARVHLPNVVPPSLGSSVFIGE